MRCSGKGWPVRCLWYNTSTCAAVMNCQLLISYPVICKNKLDVFSVVHTHCEFCLRQRQLHLKHCLCCLHHICQGESID